ncbi:hypothetical protein ACFVHB_21135 [Kitasatospora sp. NPDC127111]|uniref:hypothetical protein n=1 Tax=Kitasatospora sp. NPDC127111 TaxID=3345363 RepID=UPI0036457DBB
MTVMTVVTFMTDGEPPPFTTGPVRAAEPGAAAPARPPLTGGRPGPADVTFGRHPEHGIVAADRTGGANTSWMLRRLGFDAVPGHHQLYALTEPAPDGVARTRAAVKLMRRAGYLVAADGAFDGAFDSGLDGGFDGGS